LLKLVAIGVWIIAVTAGATFGSVYIAKSSGPAEAEEEPDQGVEELKSEMTSFPIMRNGGITGYLILQLSFSADRRHLAERKLDPLPYLMDAAFRVIFARTEVDFRRLRSKDLEEVTSAIAKEVNARLGVELVRHVLVQQVNFVNKEDIRTNWINDVNGSE
jgi:flagellar basal body-associated protein FliL